jgi:hypothetical protein
VSAFKRKAFLPTLEDVLVTKLRWLHLAGRKKDEGDVQVLLKLHSDRIDWPYVESWCDRHGTRGILEKLRSECADQ